MGSYAWVFDVTVLLCMGVLTWSVSSEGLYGAAVLFINAMFAGLIAFSTFEPLAAITARSVPFMASFADFVCVLFIFAVAFNVLRFGTEWIGPWYVRFHGLVDQFGRFAFGLATAWYVAGMLICVAQMAPVHKKFLGYQWENHSLFKVGIDRYWLGFVRSATAKQFEWNSPRPFDARADFIMRYHRFRPFGEPDLSMPGYGKAGSGEAAGAAGGAAGDTGSSEDSGGRPVLDPTGASQNPF